MVKVEIQSAEAVTEKSGTSARTQKPYHIREQQAFAHLPGQPYPVQCVVNLEDGEPPYSPGLYRLADTSFFVGRFGQLMMRSRLDRDSRVDLNKSRSLSNG